MSFLARTTVRVTPRFARASSTGSTLPKTAKEYFEQQKVHDAHHLQTAELWRKISYFVCLPAILLVSYTAYNKESEHKHHLDHLAHENGGAIPQPPEYEYLNRRGKPFPWGNNSLFFNPKMQRNMEEQS
ncbi:COX6A, subunit VIa of cytochrome c oxidase [Fistulina hepatica ATCC 64428]|uniref:COX6A, subunit VIa of cytochrome c oxidase n=1 Tax=Fistulina hepatica ATCC 64428 TaxID=1128425 RepID=A0A0D7AHD7_9AGAR|nr:COX6A, subunit VIa of cytochrome c oxidase [Fistulina hepatica ATCC 64428]